MSKAALICLQMEIFLACLCIVLQLRIRVINLQVFLSQSQECTIKSVWKVKFSGRVINILLPKAVTSSILQNKAVYQKWLYAAVSGSLSLRTKPTQMNLHLLDFKYILCIVTMNWLSWTNSLPVACAWHGEKLSLINHLSGCSLKVVPVWSVIFHEWDLDKHLISLLWTGAGSGP